MFLNEGTFLLVRTGWAASSLTHLFLKAVTLGALTPLLQGRGVVAKAAVQTLPELRWADSQVVTSTGILGKISRQFDPIPFSLSFLFPLSTSWLLLTEATARVSPSRSGSSPIPRMKRCTGHGPPCLLSERVVGPWPWVRLQVVSHVGETFTSGSPWSVQNVSSCLLSPVQPQ